MILVGCLDEIFFHGRPVLVGVEPASMTWFLGQKANDRSGATWAKVLRNWTALSYVTADAGTGLQAGIAAVQQERQEPGEPPLENGLDVFHTTHKARRVLHRAGAMWTDAGSRPKRPPAESSMRSGRARMLGAWRSRRVLPGRRPR